MKLCSFQGLFFVAKKYFPAFITLDFLTQKASMSEVLKAVPPPDNNYHEAIGK